MGKKIRLAGIQEIDQIHAQNEVGQFDSVIGGALRNLEISFKATNFVYEPSTQDTSVFWCYLTRIDDFKVCIGQDWYERKSGVYTESSAGARNTLIAAIVAGLTE